MYFQRAGVAGSPVIQLILVSSRSVKLNGSGLVSLTRCNLGTCYQNEAYVLDFTLHKAVFVRML
ncbi:hypothetical protein [Neobacillus kokaensis]|uniref:hypothetical protein n=1 Tax=Neobacillus kokaensis TaxID=2759023 RepID=UPI0017481635|nr:hypothetical protein [Neobacillus kokaensis]